MNQWAYRSQRVNKFSRCNSTYDVYVCGVFICGVNVMSVEIMVVEYIMIVYKIEFFSQISKITFKIRICSLFFLFLKCIYIYIYCDVCVTKLTPVLKYDHVVEFSSVFIITKRRESYRDTHVPLDLAGICFSVHRYIIVFPRLFLCI